MEQIATMNLIDLGSKFSSKYELNRVLIEIGKPVLLPYKETSIEFITDFLQLKRQIDTN